jgi:hypothetical protein
MGAHQYKPTRDECVHGVSPAGICLQCDKRLGIPVVPPDRCPECARAEIFVHTARLERAHDREVIEALKAKLAEAERALRQQQKGKK